MMQPLHDTVIVRPDPKPESASTIIFVAPDEVLTGTVVAVGPGKRRPNGQREPMWVSPGDRIQYSGTVDKQHDGLLLRKNGDIIGLVA